MRITKLLSLLLLAAMCVLISCTKTEMFEDIPQTAITKNTSSNDKSSYRYTPDEREERKKTVLGRKRNNPFALENFKQAKVNIYGSGTALVEATHLYVKFKPTEQEHLAILEDWEITQEIPLFDFPLEYEVVSMGEQYVDPEVSEAMFTYMYGSIPIDTELPTVPYEVVDKLYLGKDYPLVLTESFRLTGNEAEAETYLVGEHGIDVGILADEPVGLLPMIPECDPGCEAVLIIEPGSMPPAFEWICECDDDGGDVPELNDCGCPVPWSNNTPAGCVQVEADDGSSIPVKQVLVKLSNGWFNNSLTITDENGCWQAEESYTGKLRMWTQFKNYRVKVKNFAPDFFNYAVKVVQDFVWELNSGAYNNLTVLYPSFSGMSNPPPRKYWVAAHTLNAVHDYREKAIADNIPLPRNLLNWVNIAGDPRGSAAMLQGNPYNSWVGFYLALNIPVGYPEISSLLPDITNGYSEDETAFSLDLTAYHELAHASHYTSVGEVYWIPYRNHIINNNGYGEYGGFAANSHPGHVALGEAVANYIGYTYMEQNNYAETIDFNNGFIPEGLLYDLYDDTPWEVITDPNDSSINSHDIISGFTTEMFFNALSPDVNSISKFKDELRDLHLNDTSNTESDFNNFLDTYDVFN